MSSSVASNMLFIQFSKSLTLLLYMFHTHIWSIELFSKLHILTIVLIDFPGDSLHFQNSLLFKIFSFGLCGRGRGWDDLGEWHWNMYNIIYETNHQSRFDAWYWIIGAGALRRPRGMVRGGRRETGQDGEHVYT